MQAPKSAEQPEELAFVAYAHEDARQARKFAADLAKRGAPVWVADEHLRPGDRWREKRLQAVPRFPAMLVLVSPSGVASAHIAGEVRLARQHQILIIPVLMTKSDELELPQELEQYRPVDLWGSSYDAGLDSIAEVLRSAALQTGQPSTSSAQDELLPSSSPKDTSQGVQPSTPSSTREPVLRLRRKGEPDWSEVRVTKELRAAFERGARIHRRGAPKDGIELTYTSILLGLAFGQDTLARRLFQNLPETSLHALLAREKLEQRHVEAWLADSGAESSVSEGLELSTSGAGILRRALEIQERCSPRAPELDGAHVLAAYLLPPDIHPGELAGHGVPLADVTAALLAHVAGHRPDELEAWRKLAAESGFEAAAPTSQVSEPQQTADEGASPPDVPRPSRWDRASFHVDRVREGEIDPRQDRLGVSAPALRFAKLLVAADVKPPIALGLFGNWGSGKSFFMGLMRHHVRTLCEEGARSRYVARVAQIDFNAWHYQDTNLWASLALRIYEGLASELSGTPLNEVEQLRRELTALVHSNEERRKLAEDRRSEAERERRFASDELARERKRREAIQRKGLALKAERLWKAIARDEAFIPHEKVLTDCARGLGLEAALGSASDLERLREQFEELHTRTQVVGSALGARFGSVRSGLATTAVIFLVLGATYAVGPGVDALQRLLGFAENDFEPLSTFVVQLAGLVSAGAAWASRQMMSFSKGLSAVERIQARYREIEAESQLSEKEQKAQKLVQRLDARIRRTDEEIADADRALTAAVNELRRIDEGGLVYDFLMERQEDDRYLGELGLISTIRRDLEKLRTRMKDFEAHASKRTGKGADPRGAIKRVVLYIDDLDRCHPEKVVQVLQAVHLLLAFDLFHVVVGVDARWLERSLYREYVGETDSTRAPGSRVGEHAFSPQNYLEKIFQVPYSLAPMDPGGFARLVGKLVTTRSEVEARQAKAGGEGEGGTSPGAGTPGALEGQPAGREQGRVTTADSDEQTTGTEGDADGEQPAPRSQEQVEHELEPLFLEDHEEAFISALYGFVDTGRLAKRLVNIYLLLRLGAGEDGREDFPGDAEHGEHRTALTLLAIQVGFPRIASELLWMVARKPPVADLAALLAALAPARAEERPEWARALPDWREDQLEDLAALRGKLAALREATELDLDLAAFVDWAPRVGVYSSRWHLVGQDGHQRATPPPEDER